MTAGNTLLTKGSRIGLSSEGFNGSDCGGSDKTSGRTLSFASKPSVIILERKPLDPVNDYSWSAGVITFNVTIDNRHKGAVFY